eukprot:COSAG02_NODE_38053_length_434_cov_0.716418_1_plen_91_part_10
MSAVRIHLTSCAVDAVPGVLQEGCIALQQLEFSSTGDELVEQLRHRHYSHATVRASPELCSKVVSVSASEEVPWHGFGRGDGDTRRVAIFR